MLSPFECRQVVRGVAAPQATLLSTPHKTEEKTERAELVEPERRSTSMLVALLVIVTLSLLTGLLAYLARVRFTAEG